MAVGRCLPRALSAGRTRHTPVLRAVPSPGFPHGALQMTKGDPGQNLLPSAGPKQQHPGGMGAAASEQGWCQPPAGSWGGSGDAHAAQHHQEPAQHQQGAGSPNRGRALLGIGDAEGFHRVAQPLAHPADRQQAVPDHDAGAGAARGGHRGQALPLVLLGVEGLRRLQDGRLVP